MSGKSLYSERLHKADKPPQLLSGIYMANSKDVETNNVGTTKDDNSTTQNTHNKENPSLNIPGATGDKEATQVVPAENRVQKPNARAPQMDGRVFFDRLKKGAENQLGSMRVVYGELSTNFPERFQR